MIVGIQSKDGTFQIELPATADVSELAAKILEVTKTKNADPTTLRIRDTPQGEDKLLSDLMGFSLESLNIKDGNTLQLTYESYDNLPTTPNQRPRRQISIPEEWDVPYDNTLLLQRIQERIGDPGCGGDQWKKFPNISPQDPAAGFISARAAEGLRRFTFNREDHILKDLAAEKYDPEERMDRIPTLAFYVIDSDQYRRTILDTRPVPTSDPAGNVLEEHDEVSKHLEYLSRSRSSTSAYTREIHVHAFTPSALATILLSAPKDKHHDYATMYAALRRHLSTKIADRYYYEFHGFTQGDGLEAEIWHMKSFTVPYFALTNKKPANDLAPLTPSGIFGVGSFEGKYIREEKFTVSRIECGPYELMATFSAPFQREISESRFPLYQWVMNNLRGITWKWGEVLDSLDEQTSLPSTIIFNEEMRRGILFEDENFTNSKRYFWALQSLRLFGEHIETTRRVLPHILHSLREPDFYQRSKDDPMIQQMNTLEKDFEELFARIGRKRDQIQSLNDGLFSASSVADGRISAEQNANIRLLTLVTIAYTPAMFIASIYGMSVLPSSADLVSFFVATAVLCVITFLVVLNLRNVELLLYQSYRGRTAKLQEKMREEESEVWKFRGSRLREAELNDRIGIRATNWWYFAYLVSRLTGWVKLPLRNREINPVLEKPSA